jgi:Ca2+-binding EF-hand superfamily protein
MGRKKSVDSEPKNKFDKRLEIRDYIKNERDTVLKKWMALEEGIRAEDHRRDEAAEKRVSDLTRKLPENIRKFIGTLKKAVRTTMAKTGGTPYSIIRNMFLYWDADKSGEISAEELKGAVNSLGAKMTDKQREEVVHFYANHNKISRAETGEIEMNYDQLLKDIQKGEPTIIDSNAASKFKKIEECYEEVQVVLPEKSLIVKQFIEATQNYISGKMRVHGGTPYQHCRDLFTHFDYDFSSGLNAEELRRAGKKGMGLDITAQQAQQIINYYDYKKTGQLTIHMGFIQDVNAGVQHILAYTEVTATSRKIEQSALAANPFMAKPFKAKSNKSIECFKKNVAEALVRKIKELGGTSSSWVKEAFLTWDPRNTGKLSEPEAVIGVAKRIGFDLSVDEALILIKSYDKFGTNELIYSELIKDLKIEDIHFLSDPSVTKKTTTSTTARMPQSINDSIKNFKRACGL